MKLDDIRPAPYNPRKQLSPTAAKSLGKSLERFGDISGITWNRTTGNLVAGHKRVELLLKLGAKWHARSKVFIMGGQHYPVRVVEWSVEEEKAANVAANNQALAADFDDTLEGLLEEIRGALGDEEFLGLSYDALGLDIPGTDPVEEWENMPAYEHDDPDFRRLVVHFKDQEAVDAFVRLVGCRLTTKTKYIWYPEQANESTVHLGYVSDEA